MIWLTWRQFRTQAWAGVAILVVVAAALAATAPGLYDLYDRSGLAACTTDCGGIADTFKAEVSRSAAGALYLGATALMFLLPALIGVFWGAPLVARELETGTHRLVWSQTVTRERWLAVKLAGVGLGTMLVAGLISLAVTWWAGPIDEVSEGRITPLLFAARGIVPLGYAAFAFIVGVLVGLLTRRTVLAMAVTLLLVALVQVAMPTFVRPAISSPVHTMSAFDPDRIRELGIHGDNSISVFLRPPVDGAWTVENRTVDTSGAEFTGPVDTTKCGMDAGGGPRACEAWLGSLGLRQDITYVPAERFWTLQWRELGVFAGMTALLALFCVWWIRRRVA
jgi:ABC-type transport system involved in multi-copper enzyme maturation permease subunit